MNFKSSIIVPFVEFEGACISHVRGYIGEEGVPLCWLSSWSGTSEKDAALKRAHANDLHAVS